MNSEKERWRSKRKKSIRGS